MIRDVKPKREVLSALFLAAGLMALLIGVAQSLPSKSQDGKDAGVYGVLQPQMNHLAQNYKAGVRVVTLEIGWNLYEPQQGLFSSDYLQQLKRRLAAYRAAGMQVMLELGIQYPPAWIFQKRNSRFINQYGDAFAADPTGGNCGVNAVFNPAMRDLIGAYVRQVFADLGTDFYAVRLGGGRYGEVGYPDSRYAGKSNCYWAFDPLAQGKVSGLPAGMKPCPVPGWIPGTPSPDHAAARAFANWYMACLQNYHDWQIAHMRRYYHGPLAMLYPSFGIRPGQLDLAVSGDLNGGTSPEKNGEVQRGFDFARFVAGIRDPKVIVYGTGIDFPRPGPYVDDTSDNPALWCSIHWLSTLAAAHHPPLAVWGENAGHNDAADMQLCFRRVRMYGLMGMMWAFDPELHDKHHASIEDYARLIAQEKLRGGKNNKR